MQTNPYVIVPFVGYLVAVFAIAIFAHRYQKRSDFETEYYVGGRSFGAWVLALSWVATMASGGSFLGYPSLVYSYGWVMALWVSGSTVTALMGLGIIGKRINRLARQTGALTLVDLIRDRYSSNTLGVLYAVLIVIVTFVYLIAQFVAGARILESMLGMSYVKAMTIFAVATVAYTTYGGFRAVAWTDTLQGIIMIIGIVLLMLLTLSHPKVGDLEKATRAQAAREDPQAKAVGIRARHHAYIYGPGPLKIQKEDRTDSSPPGSKKPSPWLPIGMGISMFMLRSLGAVMMPTTVPRMLAFRDTKSLRRALILLAPYLMLMYGSSLITMNCAHQLDLGLGPNESDKAVPELAKLVAPEWLAGLLIAAPFAAVMSTVDSALLVVSASVVRDLVRKTVHPNLTNRSAKWLSYAVTAGAGALACVVASILDPGFLQPLVIHYVGSAASALFWPSLMTLYFRRATAAGMIAGLSGGAVMYAVAIFQPPLGHLIQLHPFVYGFTASGLLCWAVSLLTQPQPEEQVERYFGRG